MFRRKQQDRFRDRDKLFFELKKINFEDEKINDDNFLEDDYSEESSAY